MPDRGPYRGLAAEHRVQRRTATARKLKLEDGRPLTAVERREEQMARRVGRPAKPESAKAKLVMISMTPSLIKAARQHAKRVGRTLSGLIAESLAEKIKYKAL